MTEESIRLLVLNGGSTSTKVAVYENDKPVFTEVLRHRPEDLEKFPLVWDQYDFRRAAIEELLAEKGFKLSDFTAFVSRGACAKPVPGGVYLISGEMVKDGRRYGLHASNIGCQIAYDFGNELTFPALTVDPPSVDEMIPEAHVAGLPIFSRKSWFQALNQKAVARRLAAKLGKKYEDMSAVVVHMGGGMSVAAHEKGKVIDVNNGLDGDGPMAPERAGTVPAGELIDLCFSGKHSQAEIRHMIQGRGGLVAYLGTTDGAEIEKRIAAGDEKAKLAYDAMIYQIAKSIGAAAVSLKGKTEAIALTGGLAHSEYITGKIAGWVDWIAKVHLFPGENEMESLALGALAYLRGLAPAQKY